MKSNPQGNFTLYSVLSNSIASESIHSNNKSDGYEQFINQNGLSFQCKQCPPVIYFIMFNITWVWRSNRHKKDFENNLLNCATIRETFCQLSVDADRYRCKKLKVTHVSIPLGCERNEI